MDYITATWKVGHFPRSGDVIHPQLLGTWVWVRDYYCIDQLRRKRLSLGWPYKAIITTNVLVVGVNFGGHFGGQNVQVSMAKMEWSRVVYNRQNKSVRKEL